MKIFAPICLPVLKLNQRNQKILLKQVDFGVRQMPQKVPYQYDNLFLDGLNDHNLVQVVTITDDRNNALSLKLQPNTRLNVNLGYYFPHYSSFLIFRIDGRETKVILYNFEIQMNISCGQLNPFPVRFDDDDGEMKKVWFYEDDDIFLTWANVGNDPANLRINNHEVFIEKNCTGQFNLKMLINDDSPGTIAITLDGVVATKYAFHLRHSFPMFYVTVLDENSREKNRRSIYCIPGNDAEEIHIFRDSGHTLMLEWDNEDKSSIARQLTIVDDDDEWGGVVKRGGGGVYTFKDDATKLVNVSLDDDVRFTLNFHRNLQTSRKN